jgi:hypothetical protein
MSELGDCYEVHGKMMLKPSGRNFILVHAEVMGQGQLAGIPYGHCFLINKMTGTVTDRSNGRNIQMPKEIYYMLGKIDQSEYWDDTMGRVSRTPKIFEYTQEEARDLMLETGTFGPWELETESGY